MKDIAAEAGVAPGLAHYYFETKEDLLVAAIERGRPMGQPARHLPAEGDDPRFRRRGGHRCVERDGDRLCHTAAADPGAGRLTCSPGGVNSFTDSAGRCWAFPWSCWPRRSWRCETAAP